MIKIQTKELNLKDKKVRSKLEILLSYIENEVEKMLSEAKENPEKCVDHQIIITFIRN